MPPIAGEWAKALQGEFRKPYYKKLFTIVGEEYRTKRIYPPADDIFNAFHFTPLDQVKVVILGQDPYHGPGQANGLAFSVAPGVKLPPSLQNIFKELQADLQVPLPSSGDLTPWAQQGVLLPFCFAEMTAQRRGNGRDFVEMLENWGRISNLLALARKIM